MNPLMSLTLLLQTSVMRRNDHSTIGAILAAVLTPAILWKRANVVNRECAVTTYISEKFLTWLL